MREYDRADADLGPTFVTGVVVEFGSEMGTELAGCSVAATWTTDGTASGTGAAMLSASYQSQYRQSALIDC